MKRTFWMGVSVLVVMGQACHAVAAPLSCGMKRDLVTVSAQLRDIGVPQKDVRAKLTAPGELTKDEVDAILKVAYGSMKTVPPEKIGSVVYNLCAQVQRR